MRAIWDGIDSLANIYHRFNGGGNFSKRSRKTILGVHAEVGAITIWGFSVWFVCVKRLWIQNLHCFAEIYGDFDLKCVKRWFDSFFTVNFTGTDRFPSCIITKKRTKSKPPILQLLKVSRCCSRRLEPFQNEFWVLYKPCSKYQVCQTMSSPILWPQLSVLLQEHRSLDCWICSVGTPRPSPDRIFLEVWELLVWKLDFTVRGGPVMHLIGDQRLGTCNNILCTSQKAPTSFPYYMCPSTSLYDFALWENPEAIWACQNADLIWSDDNIIYRFETQGPSFWLCVLCFDSVWKPLEKNICPITFLSSSSKFLRKTPGIYSQAHVWVQFDSQCSVLSSHESQVGKNPCYLKIYSRLLWCFWKSGISITSCSSWLWLWKYPAQVFFACYILADSSWLIYTEKSGEGPEKAILCDLLIDHFCYLSLRYGCENWYYIVVQHLKPHLGKETASTAQIRGKWKKLLLANHNVFLRSNVLYQKCWRRKIMSSI